MPQDRISIYDVIYAVKMSARLADRPTVDVWNFPHRPSDIEGLLLHEAGWPQREVHFPDMPAFDKPFWHGG